MMKISNKCLDIVKHYESFKPNPYVCPAGVVTIGYGTTRYENGSAVKLTDPAITEDDATELMKNDLSRFEKDVNSLLKVKITQDQFDALVSFAYNVGSDIDKDIIPEGLGDSTLLKLINNNIMVTAPDWKRQISKQFLSWIKGTVKGKRRVLAGLVARRTTESFLFCNGEVKFFN